MPTVRQVLVLILAWPLIWPAAAAQSLAARLNQPPAGVEDTLRDRVTRFYTLQMEGKFRQAEGFVCEDSLDAYYDSKKNRWTSATLVSVAWEDSFRTGKVLMSLGTQMQTMTGTMAALYPLTATWKVQNNAWCYHLPPEDQTETKTPFGVMKAGPPSPNGGSAMANPAPPVPSDIARMVKVSKPALRLKSDADSSDSLEISNGLASGLRLVVQASEMPGLEWKLSSTYIKQGEKSILSVVYKPVDQSHKRTFPITVMIEPFGSIVNIPVTFAPPPVAPLPQLPTFPPEIKKK